MAQERKRLSRFQVRCEGRPAWAVGTRDRRYYFDGMRFWSLGGRSSQMMTAWQAPGFGWVHEEECGCALCTVQEEQSLPKVA